jgi:hypothetical protein
MFENYKHILCDNFLTVRDIKKINEWKEKFLEHLEEYVVKFSA